VVRIRAIDGPPGGDTCSSPAAIRPDEHSSLLLTNLVQQLDGLPNDLGITLLVLGTCGILIPGPIPPGLLLVALGAVVLRPKLVVRFGRPMARRFPGAYCTVLGIVSRFRADLAHRFPDAVLTLNSSSEVQPSNCSTDAPIGELSCTHTIELKPPG
jgi:hypothetical protein